ncbi:uncharacterized protein LOC117544178 [Gymnodraco acuticeps]|uniref:Uncharacterized protein LOC117544178 n=1 Tax=Gymnodraco acuticeps TaxID=8218 RepID=A0A6P8TX41_GYMAC|nr:uncharacterized protein LOC117544178 [Gymnodraco acuticeps]
MLGKVLFVVTLLGLTLMTIRQLSEESSTKKKVHREKKWSLLNDDPWNHNDKTARSPRMTNAWYAYVHQLVTKTGRSNCYVCSHMPWSTGQVTLYGKRMSKSQAKCFATMGGVGYQHSGIKVNDVNPYAPGLSNGTCNKIFWVNFNMTVPRKMTGQKVVMPNNEAIHPMCYSQTEGSVPMGNTTGCNQTLVNGEGAPVYLSKQSNGTWWVQGGWWLCGNNAYPVLPINWTGTCAPIFVSDHTFVIDIEPHLNHTRRRRNAMPAFKKHDSVWGKDVPDEFKHWSTSGKVILALTPALGVAKNMLRLETLDYRFGMFVNNSIVVNEQQNLELDSLRTMVLQHRMALDLLTASVGGTCILLNTICCTYITDNVHSQNMTDAMATLKALQTAMGQDRHASLETGWFNWLLSGSWVQKLVMGFVAIICVVILVCCAMACIIPCVKAMVGKIVTNTLVQYTMLQQTDNDDYTDTDPSQKDEYTHLTSNV